MNESVSILCQSKPNIEWMGGGRWGGWGVNALVCL